MGAVPLAAAVKETLLPMQTLRETGFVVTVGAVFTKTVADPEAVPKHSASRMFVMVNVVVAPGATMRLSELETRLL